jgi:septum formation protein
MQKTDTHPKLILASQSPRRKYLLEQAGLTFDVIPSSVDESTVPLQDPKAYVKILAEAKATDVADRHPDHWVIGADTIVLINGTILGKPGSIDEASKMLKTLSGQTHQVLTGYAIICRAAGHTFSSVVTTDVRFKDLAEKEIEWYIHTQEPFDKAGAYAIQGLGTFLVRSITGSYTNVVGLPVCETVEHLISNGAITIDRNNRSATSPDGPF